MKISIIGTGNVGSVLAYQLATSGITSELVLVDTNANRAKAEGLDINHAIPQYSGYCRIETTSRNELTTNSDFIILTASVPFPVKKDESGAVETPNRNAMAESNIKLYQNIIPDLCLGSPEAFYIIVANPNDILVRLISETTNIPKNKILGTGTFIDTGRVLSILSRKMGRQYHLPETIVVGEHSDQQFIPKSCWDSETGERSEDIIKQAINESMEVFLNKNFSTCFAISSACCALVKAVYYDQHILIPVSSYFDFGNELKGYLSMPRIITKDGIEQTIKPVFNKMEEDILHNSIFTINDFKL